MWGPLEGFIVLMLLNLLKYFFYSYYLFDKVFTLCTLQIGGRVPAVCRKFKFQPLDCRSVARDNCQEPKFRF